MARESLYGLTFEQLEAWLKERDYKKSRALLVWDYIYVKKVVSFGEMIDLPGACRQLLEENFILQSLTEEVRQESEDGTVKFLFRLRDGNLIETVLLKPKFGFSVCLTTQVGCNMGCSFCASGQLAKIRDLESGEIIEQIVQVQRYLDQMRSVAQDHPTVAFRVTHVVVMGIGEPLDNFKNLSTSLQIMKEQRGLNIAGKHITVSTSGLADKIYEFADKDFRVNLAVSLHAPTDDLRTQLMRINKTFSIEGIMQAVAYYIEKTKRRVCLEYLLLRELNDSEEHALQLAGLIGNLRKLISVNLIPYNPVAERQGYQRSDHQVMLNFYDVLKKRDILCGIRLEQGKDIEAACGQLRSRQIKAVET